MFRHKTNVHSSITIRRLDWIQKLIFFPHPQPQYRTSKIDQLHMSLGIREVTLEYLLCAEFGSWCICLWNLLFLLTLSSFGELTAVAS